MTLEQCKRLKEMGFPQNGLTDTYYTWEGYKMFPVCVGVRPSTDKEKWDYCGNWYDNPTAEEALAWVAGKLDNDIYLINFNPTSDGIEISAWCDSMQIYTEEYPTLSDAVYALIEWAYENKLLEA
jgi:hypothetical protein